LKGSFAKVAKRRYIIPDGGFLYASDGKTKQLVLISEIKRQGTNDKRRKEGLSEQSMGNAIERLAKNLIAIRALFKGEVIIPFICFGSGEDFKPGSYIRERVVTINEFFPLDKLFINKIHAPFEPVSMLFRTEEWLIEEMIKKMQKIVEIAIAHYFPKI
jgi:type II restriction enzyme